MYCFIDVCFKCFLEKTDIKLRLIQSLFLWNDAVCIFQVVTCPNASFTDLAEIVSRIEPVKNALIEG